MSGGIVLDMGKGINIIKPNCEPLAAKDSTLPRDSYLVTYGDNNDQKYDIVQGLQSDIFDHYWDHYRHDLINMTQTEGRVNPKLWGAGNKSPDKKKK